MKNLIVASALLLTSAIVTSQSPVAPSLRPRGSLRFYGNGVGDIDRVKIRIDDPLLSNDPGPPADVGASDFTIEFWLRAFARDNQGPAIQQGANYDWILGNIIFDRDRYNQGRAFGISIAGGVLACGVQNAAGQSYTIVGTVQVLDGAWHHIAFQRRRSDGWLELFVDGLLDTAADGPGGDISYPDDGVPGNYCQGPCDFSDPFIVIGAEKHDAGPSYPSYNGWLDELRISTALRYSMNYSVPTSPFTTDPFTVGLYHMDEGHGNVVHDTSGANGGPSQGDRRFGGNPPGPQWSSESAF